MRHRKRRSITELLIALLWRGERLWTVQDHNERAGER